MTKAYFGSNGENRFIIETPDWLKKQVIEEFGEFYDPCPVDPTEDGLATDWNQKMGETGSDCVYVNPPYTRGNIKKWVWKCYREHLSGCGPIILLIPSYTDTEYFHDCIYQKEGVEIRFFKGRIKFKGYTDGRASFASMLIIFGGASSGRSLAESHDPFPNRLIPADHLEAAMHPNQMKFEILSEVDKE